MHLYFNCSETDLGAVDIVLLHVAAHARKSALLLGVAIQPDVTRDLTACTTMDLTQCFHTMKIICVAKIVHAKAAALARRTRL